MESLVGVISNNACA
jgi:hypothetical protein